MVINRRWAIRKKVGIVNLPHYRVCSSTGESGKCVQRNSLITRKFYLWHSTCRWMNAEAQNDIPHAYTTFQLSLENFATYTQLSHFMTYAWHRKPVIRSALKVVLLSSQILCHSNFQVGIWERLLKFNLVHSSSLLFTFSQDSEVKKNQLKITSCALTRLLWC